MPNIKDALRTLAAQSLAVLARVRTALPKFTIVWDSPDEDDDRAAARRRVHAAVDVGIGLSAGTGVTPQGAGANEVYRTQHPRG